ncbi:MAG: energy-coupling factor ABC transporter ATP-binding protein [Candidatus Heimdallarchaeota archaeon]
MGSQVTIELKDINFSYLRSKSPVLKNINLTVNKGEFLGIMGPTGAGKTTLLYCMNGVIPHYLKGYLTGDVIVNGKSTRDLTLGQLSQIIGLVMQDPEAQLFNLFVNEELAWGLENRGLPKEEIIKRRQEALEFFEIDYIQDSVTYDLSGGEKQKVSIASIFALGNEIIFLDEPTSELDPIGTVMVFDAIKKLASKEGTTIVMVEHKAEELAEFADRLVLLNNGEIVNDAEPREFFAQKKLLEEAGISTPQVTELSYDLEARGVSLNKIPLTLDEATSIYKELKRR